MYWLGAKSAVKQAVPTLQGLALRDSTSNDGAESVTVFPWTRVGVVARQEWGRWRVYEEDGRPMGSGGRPLQLRLRGGRACAIARRAQRRAFEQAWKRGDLSITDRPAPEMSRSHGWMQLSLSALLLIAFVAWFGPRAVRAWSGGDPPFPTEYLWLLRGTTIGMCFSAVVLLMVPMRLGYFIIARVNVLRIMVGCRGIEAILTDGTECAAEWRELGDFYLLGFPRIRFKDGPCLWTGPLPPRTRLALEIIRRNAVPEAVAREKRILRRMYVRTALLWAVGCVAVGFALNRYGTGDTSALASAGIALLLFVAGVAASYMLVKQEELSLSTPASRRHRKRRRRTT